MGNITWHTYTTHSPSQVHITHTIRIKLGYSKPIIFTFPRNPWCYAIHYDYDTVLITYRSTVLHNYYYYICVLYRRCWLVVGTTEMVWICWWTRWLKTLQQKKIWCTFGAVTSAANRRLRQYDNCFTTGELKGSWGCPGKINQYQNN